jgi:Transposase DDE domain group 1
MADDAPFLPGLSPVAGKPVQVTFDAGRLSSDGGVLVLAEIERRLGIAERLARCLEDPRAPDRVQHGLAEMIRFRALLIAAGYADANDCDTLRVDPVFKMAVGRLPESAPDLCSQPTMCRLENLPGPIALKRMMAAEPLRLPAVEDCLHDIGRKQGQPQDPTDVALGDVLGVADLADRGVYAVVQHALPPPRARAP